MYNLIGSFQDANAFVDDFKSSATSADEQNFQQGDPLVSHEDQPKRKRSRWSDRVITDGDFEDNSSEGFSLHFGQKEIWF